MSKYQLRLDADKRIPEAVSVMDTNLFTKDFLISVVNLLLTHYICLTSEDMSLWQEDPESFVLEEDADHWEYQKRACAEKVLMVLVTKHREFLAPFLVQNLKQISASDNLQLKESIYNAAGICAHDLFDYLDFDDWMRNHLVHQIQNHSPE